MGILLKASFRFAIAASLFATAQACGQTGGAQRALTSEAVTLPSTPGRLYGTLLRPSDSSPVPVVLIHPGSGPTDRDGNSALLPGKNNSLRLLAEGLAARGIATLRIDKRGIGASAGALGSESDLRFETYVKDAVDWLRLLQRDKRFSRVLVLGHSEGALVGALAAREANADGYISLPGPGQRGSAILRQQLKDRLPAPLIQVNEHILSTLEQGQRIDSIPTPLLALYRSSVQPYLISWFRYDPAQEVGRLTMPVLVAYGTTDRQVDTMEAVLLYRALSHGRKLRVEGMNHVLKLVDGDLQQQVASYSDSTLVVAPALLDGVAAFVHSVAAIPRVPK